MPDNVEKEAQEFIAAGGWFESEMLTDYKTVSLTACWNTEEGPDDIAGRFAENGPAVVDAVAALVHEAVQYARAALAKAEGK